MPFNFIGSVVVPTPQSCSPTIISDDPVNDPGPSPSNWYDVAPYVYDLGV